MEVQEKDCIEYALHAYDTFWDYYKRTLDERNQILNNYIIVVGIPISLIGITIERLKDDISYCLDWIVLAFVVVLIFGIVIYNAYIVESFISERYLKKIEHITEYLMQHYDENYRGVFSEAYSLDKIFLDKNESQKHKLRKGFLVIIINTIIIIGIIYLKFLKQKIKYYIFWGVLVSLFVHMVIFVYHWRKGI